MSTAIVAIGGDFLMEGKRRHQERDSELAAFPTLLLTAENTIPT